MFPGNFLIKVNGHEPLWRGLFDEAGQPESHGTIHRMTNLVALSHWTFWAHVAVMFLEGDARELNSVGVRTRVGSPEMVNLG